MGNPQLSYGDLGDSKQIDAFIAGLTGFQPDKTAWVIIATDFGPDGQLMYTNTTEPDP